MYVFVVFLQYKLSFCKSAIVYFTSQPASISYKFAEINLFKSINAIKTGWYFSWHGHFVCLIYSQFKVTALGLILSSWTKHPPWLLQLTQYVDRSFKSNPKLCLLWLVVLSCRHSQYLLANTERSPPPLPVLQAALFGNRCTRSRMATCGLKPASPRRIKADLFGTGSPNVWTHFPPESQSGFASGPGCTWWPRDHPPPLLVDVFHFPRLVAGRTDAGYSHISLPLLLIHNASHMSDFSSSCSPNKRRRHS